MRKIRLYSEMPPVVGTPLILTGDTHRQINKVLRLTSGMPLTLICGDGFDYASEILSVSPSETTVNVLAKTKNACTPRAKITLGIALLKGEAMDWVLQKAVELGVSAIVPLITARSERKIVAVKWPKKQDRWQGILRAAALQCGRAEWPTLAAPQALSEFLAVKAERKWIFSPHHAGVPEAAPPASIALLIGPEGGFSEAEVGEALAAGWQSESLGPRILRADTAAVSALVKANMLLGEMC